jgi:hypothetical protein
MGRDGGDKRRIPTLAKGRTASSNRFAADETAVDIDFVKGEFARIAQALNH